MLVILTVLIPLALVYNNQLNMLLKHFEYT
jgi:hypothetical protein